MNQIISLIIHFLLCALEIYMFNIFLGAMFLKRLSRRQWLVCFVTASCIQHIINSQGILLLNFVVISFLYFVFSMLVFEITVKRAFVYTAIYSIIFACGREAAFEMLYRLLVNTFPRMEIAISFADGMFFYALEYLLSFFFILYLRKYIKEIEIREGNSIEWYLLIMPAPTVLISYSFFYMDFPEEKYLQIWMCCGAFLLYFSNAVIFIVLGHFSQAMNRIKVAELSLLKKDMEKENFENITKINNVYRKYMHDIHQYFYQFKNLVSSGESEVIIDIIDGWENNLNREESNRLYTDSAVVNSLLSGCYDNAKEKQIDIDIFVEDALDLDFIQDVDKISMFGNLLDNAVEAAEECEEGSRKINIKMFMGNKHFLIFRIENTWTKNLCRDGERLLSTKKDAGNHGLGIGISRELAEKYNGSLELEERGEWFITTLMTAH